MKTTLIQCNKTKYVKYIFFNIKIRDMSKIPNADKLEFDYVRIRYVGQMLYCLGVRVLRKSHSIARNKTNFI